MQDALVYITYVTFVELLTKCVVLINIRLLPLHAGGLGTIWKAENNKINMFI